jgi:hypothetical protein
MKVHALPPHKFAPREPVYPKQEGDQEIPFYGY